MVVSIIIPAYNEELQIREGVLAAIAKQVKQFPFSWEIIFVDDGSTDETLRLLQAFSRRQRNFHVLALPHRGKGPSILSGIQLGRGEYIFFTDFDQSTPLSEVKRFLAEFENGYDVVIGSRRERKNAPIIRQVTGFGFQLLRKVVLRMPFSDTQCGFKAFTADAAKLITKNMRATQLSQTEGVRTSVSFDLELLYIAMQQSLRVAEVSVAWQHKKTIKFSIIRDSWNAFVDLIRVRLAIAAGKYAT